MRILKEDLHPGAQFGPMDYSHALSAIESLVGFAYPNLPRVWKAIFSQPVPKYVAHKYFTRNKSAQGLVELINPRLEKKSNGPRTEFSTIADFNLEIPVFQNEDQQRIELLLSGVLHFNGRIRGVVA